YTTLFRSWVATPSIRKERTAASRTATSGFGLFPGGAPNHRSASPHRRPPPTRPAGTTLPWNHSSAMLSETGLRSPQPDSYFSACSTKSEARTVSLVASRLRTSLPDWARTVIHDSVVRFRLAQGGGSAA